MKHVISASRRTDIPAFYLKWFMEHISRGYIDVANPFNRKQVRRVPLSPRDVEWIVFWSRNYEPFMKRMNFFDHYRLFFHFTINPANPWLEPDMIAPPVALKQLKRLVKRFGPDVIIWRYDPVVFFRRNGMRQTNHEISTFRNMVREISHMGLQRCYVSVAWLYQKVRRRALKIPDFLFLEPDIRERREILQEMADVASLFGIRLYSCANDALLIVSGMRKGHCIDGRLLNRMGTHRVSERKDPSRGDCGCTASIDIGDYVHTPCKYHCLYCYAQL